MLANPAMENYTYNSPILQIEGLKIASQSVYPAFVFLCMSYIFIMLANIGMVIVVCMERSLHQPMYLLYCNMAVNDIMFNSALLPRLLSDILVPPLQRFITYYECVVQAFFIHLCGTAAYTILMIMAFDRYVAICNPLHYTNVMTNNMVIKLSLSAWGVALLLVSILLGLTIRLNTCRTLIAHPVCDNPSLFKLSCESVFINNVYGLTFTVVLLSSSIGSMVVTYGKITVVCLTSKSKTLNSKALQTCSTHLAAYLSLFLCGMLTIIMHRFPQHADCRKLSAIMFHIVPSSLNPVIYGIQCKEVRKLLVNVFATQKM